MLLGERFAKDNIIFYLNSDCYRIGQSIQLSFLHDCVESLTTKLNNNKIVIKKYDTGTGQ